MTTWLILWVPSIIIADRFMCLGSTAPNMISTWSSLISFLGYDKKLIQRKLKMKTPVMSVSSRKGLPTPKLEHAASSFWTSATTWLAESLILPSSKPTELRKPNLIPPMIGLTMLPSWTFLNCHLMNPSTLNWCKKCAGNYWWWW